MSKEQVMSSASSSGYRAAFGKVGLVVAALGLLSLCHGFAIAQDEADSPRKVADALRQSIDLSAVERPLAQVIVDLERRCQAPIFFDNDIVPGSTAFGDPTVTCDFHREPLGDVLREILAKVNLDYVVRDKGVLIVTRDKARLYQRWPKGTIKAANEAKIAAALEQPTELDFTEQPLSDVVDYLKQKHEIEIQFDQGALKAAGVTADTPVTRTLRGIALESALGLVLGELGLISVIHDEVLLITSSTAAQSMVETRVYPVYDLVMTPPGQLPPVDGLDYDLLIAVLSEVAAAEDAASNPLRVYRPAGALIVTRSLPAHRRIERLLADLRRTKAGQSAAP
ncbi:MAG: hypothetical protein ACREHD_09645 [Pirellulales bacterium]